MHFNFFKLWVKLIEGMKNAHSNHSILFNRLQVYFLVIRAKLIKGMKKKGKCLFLFFFFDSGLGSTRLLVRIGHLLLNGTVYCSQHCWIFTPQPLPHGTVLLTVALKRSPIKWVKLSPLGWSSTTRCEIQLQHFLHNRLNARRVKVTHGFMSVCCFL